MRPRNALLAVILAAVCLVSSCLAGITQNTYTDPQQTSVELRTSAKVALDGITSPQLRARHEGMVLYLLDLLSHAKISDEKCRQAFDTHVAELRGILDALTAGKDLLTQKRGQFDWAYRSDVDGSGQPIRITLPDGYDGRTALPLVITMHGSGGDHHYGASTQGAPAHIQVGVDGRGDSDYEGLGEQDILDATAFMKANYNVDPRRIFVYGASMGAGGVIRMLAHYPDVYAGGVMLSGWATALELGNLLNTSLDIYHGDVDWVVPVDLMRLASDDLKTNKHIRYMEYPGVGHGTTTIANKGAPLALLYSVKTNDMPRRISYATDQVTRGRCHWIKIERLLDPHAPGRVNLGAGTAGIYGTTGNVSALRISELPALFPNRQNVELVLDQQKVPVAGIPNEISLVRDQGHWSLSSPKDQDSLKMPPVYQRRGCFNIYDGQPIKVIAPSGWRDRDGDRAVIQTWSAVSCIGAPPMPYGRIEIADADGFDAAGFRGHLVLVGSPENNPVVKALLTCLPVRIQDNVLTIKGLGDYPLKTTALCMTYYNPYAPECRIVWMLNANKDTQPLDLPLPDGDGYTPDILVHDISGKKPVLIAAADFGNDWSNPMRKSGSERTWAVSDLTPELALACMSGSHADYVLYQTSDWDQDAWFGAQRLSIPSLESLLPAGLQPLCRARMTASQVADLRRQLAAYKQFSVLSSDDASRTKPYYDLIFDESLIWKLGCKAHYNFPKGSLTHTGTDVHGYLRMLSKQHLENCATSATR